jgi:hypothetical protein
MTWSNSRINPKYQGIGVPEESIGGILQQGGEELAIQKLPDRFTLKLSKPQKTVQVQATELDEAMQSDNRIKLNMLVTCIRLRGIWMYYI